MTVEIVVIFILFIVLMTILEQKMGRNTYSVVLIGVLIGMLWSILIEIFR